MVNNRKKMYASNSKAKKWLIENGYFNIHLFPHSMWSKDLIIDSVGFDGICSKGTYLALFQIKSNLKISKKLMDTYRALAKKYNCECLWFNARDRAGLEVFSTEDSP